MQGQRQPRSIKLRLLLQRSHIYLFIQPTITSSRTQPLTQSACKSARIQNRSFVIIGRFMEYSRLFTVLSSIPSVSVIIHGTENHDRQESGKTILEYVDIDLVRQETWFVSEVCRGIGGGRRMWGVYFGLLLLLLEWRCDGEELKTWTFNSHSHRERADRYFVNFGLIEQFMSIVTIIVIIPATNQENKRKKLITKKNI